MYQNLLAVDEIRNDFENKNIKLIIQGGKNETTKALHLDSILKTVSSDFLDISNKPGPNGNLFLK